MKKLLLIAILSLAASHVSAQEARPQPQMTQHQITATKSTSGFRLSPDSGRDPKALIIVVLLAILIL